uniref:Uncharacterized protein n=1 Tax=Anguilla anguilla TaxID=7936 RepID=A0A0E9PUL8_ANGAN
MTFNPTLYGRWGTGNNNKP